MKHFMLSSVEFFSMNLTLFKKKLLLVHMFFSVEVEEGKNMIKVNNDFDRILFHQIRILTNDSISYMDLFF